MPASANVPGLPSLGFPFQNIFNIDGQQKFDTSPQFGAFQKPEGAQRVRCSSGLSRAISWLAVAYGGAQKYIGRIVLYRAADYACNGAQRGPPAVQRIAI